MSSLNLSMDNDSSALPVALVDRDNQKWSIVTEINTTHVLVIQGSSVETSEAEYFASYSSTSDEGPLKVSQVLSIDGQLEMLVKIGSARTILIRRGTTSSGPMLEITHGTRFSNEVREIEEGINLF